VIWFNNIEEYEMRKQYFWTGFIVGGVGYLIYIYIFTSRGYKFRNPPLGFIPPQTIDIILFILGVGLFMGLVGYIIGAVADKLNDMNKQDE
jgi:preprotein translocase subunit Sss1